MNEHEFLDIFLLKFCYYSVGFGLIDVILQSSLFFFLFSHKLLQQVVQRFKALFSPGFTLYLVHVQTWFSFCL